MGPGADGGGGCGWRKGRFTLPLWLWLGLVSIGGETGVGSEGSVSAGEIEVSMSMGKSAISMSRVSGLDWRRTGS